MTTTKIQITKTIEITDDQLHAILCTAFEGGVGYWCCIEKMVLADGLKEYDFYDGGKMQPKEGYWHWSQLVPLVPGCHLVLSTCEDNDDEGQRVEYKLDRAAIEKGLKIMSEKYPRHFDDFINENDDATTGDVFMQCCVLGEVVYG